jgi:tetratricopeptide (TPR) repeat protein
MSQADENTIRAARSLEDAEALADAWRLAGRWDDALALLRGLEPAAREAGDSALARQLGLVGRILIDQGMFGGVDTTAEREAVLDRALAHAEAAGAADLLGAFWDAKGLSLHTAYLDGDRDKEPKHELEFFERGLALRRQTGDARGVAESLFHVGLVYGVVRQDHTQALPYFQQAHQASQAAGDLVMESYAVRHIAFAQHDAGDMAGARASLAESLRLREEAGFVPGVAMALAALAYFEAHYGEKPAAMRLLQRARDMFVALGAAPRVAWVEQQIAEL